MISVIIPAYNCSNSIGRTLRCLLDQTYTEFEVIVVDDGSTDNTLGLVNSYATDNSSKIKVYSIPNGGAYAARLFGVEKAQGEWVTFVDADDTLPKNALELLVSEDDNTADIIVGTLNLNNKDIFHHHIAGVQSTAPYIEALLLHRTTVGPYAKLYRRALFERTSLKLDYRIHQNEDLLMLMKLAVKANAIKVVPDKVVYDYMLNPYGVSKQTRPLTEWFKLFSLIEDIINKTPYHHMLQSAFMTYRITTLYEQGVLKLNEFAIVEADLCRLADEASKIDLSGYDRRRLDIILSPFQRSVYGGVNVMKNKAKQFLKKILRHG